MKCKVAILKVNHRMKDEEIEEKILEAIDKIGGLPNDIIRAQKVLIKPNLGGLDARKHNGRFIAHTEPCVVRAVLRAIRAENDCEIIIADDYLDTKKLPRETVEGFYKQAGDSSNVKMIDTNDEPYVKIPVPDGGRIMRYYYFSRNLTGVDATISIQKLKVHLFSGVSLTVKNLFGLTPTSPYGYGFRFYIHYPVRLPRALVDFASIFKPSLSIIEGLVGEELQEWQGAPVESNLIIIGNNAVATDAVGTEIMGFNPQAEFPEEPFFFDINYLKLANESGLGPISLDEIELVGADVEEVRMKFRKRLALDLPPEIHERARLGLMKDARFYFENRSEMIGRYAGKYIGIQDSEVIWTEDDLQGLREKVMVRFTFKESFTRGYKMPFIKKVEPEDVDPEIYDPYFEEP